MERILIINNNVNYAKVEELQELSCEVLQGFVGGLIDIPHLSSLFYQNGVDLIVRDDIADDIDNLTAVILDKDGNMVSGIYGTILFTGYDEDGKTIGLNDSQYKFVLEQLNTRAVLTNKFTGEPKEVYVIRYE